MIGSLAAVAQPASADVSDLKINEVESNGGVPGDWVELYNAGTTPVDVCGFVQRQRRHPRVRAPGRHDDRPGRLPPSRGGSFGFGLGGADSARLYDGTPAVDSYAWTAHAAMTYGRCPNGTGAFRRPPARRRGPRTTAPPRSSGSTRSSRTAARRATGSSSSTPVPPASTSAASGSATTTHHTRTRSRPGRRSRRAPTWCWRRRRSGSASALPTRRRCGATARPSSTRIRGRRTRRRRMAAARTAPARSRRRTLRPRAPPTTAAARRSHVKLNEVESSGGSPGDWVELKNTGPTTVDVGGYRFNDNDATHAVRDPRGHHARSGRVLRARGGRVRLRPRRGGLGDAAPRPTARRRRLATPGRRTPPPRTAAAPTAPGRSPRPRRPPRTRRTSAPATSPPRPGRAAPPSPSPTTRACSAATSAAWPTRPPAPTRPACSG